MVQSVPISATSVWLHRWAVATVCATLALLLLGAVVTTFRVGMADPLWPTYPWHLLLISWEEPSPGFLIEHTHRLAGYVVGCCAIGLAYGFWRFETRPALRYLGLVALGGIILQGLIGGFRVRLNALMGTDLAAIHGCLAQVIFALLVSLSWCTSATWSRPVEAAVSPESASRVWRLSLVLVCVVLGQLVFGALLRHTFSAFSQRAHFLTAFAIATLLAWIGKGVFENDEARSLRGTLLLLAVFVGGQVLLGIEAWMVQFARGGLPGMAPITVHGAAVRTAHVLLGSGILATAVVLALQTFRLADRPSSLPSSLALEGASS